MKDKVYFYYVDSGANFRQSIGLLFIKERKYFEILFYCPSFSEIWKDVVNGLPERIISIKKPSFRPATLLEIEEAGYLGMVQGVVEYSRDGSEKSINFV